MDTTNASLFRRYRRNPVALAGLAFIAVAVGIAVFGYALVPDDTPDANRQLRVALDTQGVGIEATLIVDAAA